MTRVCVPPRRRRVSFALALSLFFVVPMFAPAQAAALDLSPYKGKVVLLDFWASWCNPCRQSFPWMGSIAETFAGQGLVILAVNVDHDRSLADDFLADNPAEFKVIYDPQGQIATQFNFHDMPTSYLIDRQGKVRFIHQGFYPAREDEYANQIRTLLNEPSH